MSNLNSLQRLVGAAVAGLALCAVVLPAAAQEAQQGQQETVQTADALTVTRDPETGKLRAATAEEQQAMQAQTLRVRQLRAVTQTPLPKVHASGARGVRLTDEFVNSATVVRKADGTLDMECHESHGGTETAAHTHAATNTPVTE